MHFQMDLVPDPVVQSRDSDKDERTGPGKEANHERERYGFDRSFVNVEANLFVRSRRNRLIGKIVRIMLDVVDNRMSPEGALKRWISLTEKVPAVHQLAVHLMLHEGHHDAREYKPAGNLQNYHSRSPDSSLAKSNGASNSIARHKMVT
jgi:hypothetical protein